RRSICSNAPRINEISPWRSSARVNALKRSVSACRRSRWRGVNTARRQPNRVPSAYGAKVPGSAAISHDVRGRLYPLHGRWPRTASGDIDHDDKVAWPHASGNDPVVTESSTAEVAAVKGAIRHKAFHCRMRASNLRTRILPVSPKTRMTYCALLRPRMYMLPD